MNEEPLDLRRFGRAVSRRRWLVVLFALGGVLAATLFSVFRVPDYTATTVVLLPVAPTNAAGAAMRDIETEVQVAQSAVVLSLASKTLPTHPPVSKLRRELAVSAPTSDVLAFKGKAKSAHEAIAIANATADAYNDYSASSATETAKQVLDPLNSDIDRLTTTIRDLNEKILAANTQIASLVPGSPDVFSLNTQVTQWNSELAIAQQQLQTATAQVRQATADRDASKAIKVISPAANASNGFLRTVSLNLGFGALSGLVLGLTVIVARESRASVLRFRSEIAAAAGAPAVASLTARRARKPSEWRALFNTYEPNANERWALRKLVRTVIGSAGEGPASVTIVSLASDDAAIAVAPQLASFAASSGLRTVLVADPRTPSLSALHQVRDLAVMGVPPHANLAIVKEMPTAVAADALAIDLTVRMIVTDLSGVDIEASRGATTVLGVSSGAAAPDLIRAISEAAAAADAPLAGIVVANPESDDNSVGTVPVPTSGHAS
jgi:uncharacterized protein involved in exopolysaccharide biosynthesis